MPFYQETVQPGKAGDSSFNDHLLHSLPGSRFQTEDPALELAIPLSPTGDPHGGSGIYRKLDGSEMEGAMCAMRAIVEEPRTRDPAFLTGIPLSN